MEVGNYLANISFAHQNETVEVVFIPIFLELFNIIMLIAGICLLYLGIEISHPVYGLLFSNLIVTTISSLINVFVFPFVKTIQYNTLVNGNNSTCTPKKYLKKTKTIQLAWTFTAAVGAFSQCCAIFTSSTSSGWTKHFQNLFLCFFSRFWVSWHCFCLELSRLVL